MLAARPHCKLPSGRGKRGTGCGASQRTGDKSERRGEGSRAGELGAPLSHARAPLRERLPHPQALRPPAAQTGSCKKENKAPARAGGGLGRPGAEGRGPAAPRPPPAPPGGPVPTRPPPRGPRAAAPQRERRRGRRRGEREAGGGGAGSGCALERRSRAGDRLPSCSNFPVSWLRSLSNSRESGRPEPQLPPPPPRAQLHRRSPARRSAPHKRGAAGGRRESGSQTQAGCGRPDTSWKLLEMAPASAPEGAALPVRALAPAGLRSRARLRGPKALALRSAAGSG